jgi:sulfate transport system ATP-binding protein
LSFLILTDGSEESRAALSLGGQIARLAHARVTILSYGQAADATQSHLQDAKERLGSGLAQLELRAGPGSAEAVVAYEVERQTFDLVILGFGQKTAADRLPVAEKILKLGDHHLLLVPGDHPEPAHALVCVTGGEPGKEDVLFAGRFLRHLGAKATLMSILPQGESKPELHDRAERFLAGGVRTLALLKVPAETVIRSGEVRAEIEGQMLEGNHDLLVLGAPLNRRVGEVSLRGVVGQIVEGIGAHPVLIVRSHFVAPGTH